MKKSRSITGSYPRTRVINEYPVVGKQNDRDGDSDGTSFITTKINVGEFGDLLSKK